MIQGTKIYIDFLPLLNKLPQTYSIKYKFGGQSLKLVFESFFLLEALGKNLLSSFWRLLLLTHAPFQFSSVQLLSHVQLFVIPRIAARQASLSITNSRSLPKPVSIESVMPSSHLILCCPLLLLPQIPPSIRVFSNESTLRMRWPK